MYDTQRLTISLEMAAKEFTIPRKISDGILKVAINTKCESEGHKIYHYQ